MWVSLTETETSEISKAKTKGGISVRLQITEIMKDSARLMKLKRWTLEII
jgi:hypothetical protein